MGKRFIKPKDEKNNEKKIEDSPEEGIEFYRFAGLFEFNNPRQLLRLHNSFRFLKALGRDEEFDTLDMLRVLFWQEFLHNWPMKVRGRCMAALVNKMHANKVGLAAKRVLENVRVDIRKLFNRKEHYAELAEFVRVVVLPHNEEGVLDRREEIKSWIAEEKKKEEEAKKKKQRRTNKS